MAPLATILGPGEQMSHAGSAGRPACNVETQIVDDDDVLVPARTVGEHQGRPRDGEWKPVESVGGVEGRRGDLGAADGAAADDHLDLRPQRFFLIDRGDQFELVIDEPCGHAFTQCNELHGQ